MAALQDDMQQGPAPVVATPRPSSLTPLDLASESLKTSDALGGFIDGDGRKLSKGVSGSPNLLHTSCGRCFR